MPSLGFASLPADIQHVICSFLWVTSPQSLHALSQTNRTCYDAAVPFLYSGLTISISTREHLCSDVTELRESKAGKHYLRHARQLQLTRQRFPPRPGNEGTSFSERHKRLRPIDPSFPTLEPLRPFYDDVFFGDPTNKGKEEVWEHWKPFILVICEFRRLNDLTYRCGGQFPPGLLDAIHRYHPTCRLHLQYFRFRSLHQSVTDPDEHALVTSPCLYSLSVPHTWRDSLGIDDYNGDAAIRTVSLAPNLKHVRMLECRPLSSAMLAASYDRPKEPWKGFVPPIDTLNRGSLISLSFWGYHENLTQKNLDEWDKLTDFSKLQEFAFSVSDPNVLMDIVEKSYFPSLKCLDIRIQRRDNNHGIKVAAEAFFDSLKSLQVLRVMSSLNCTELLANICTRHGHTLYELALISSRDDVPLAEPALSFTGADIFMIGSSCSVLSNLDISIKRSMSNRHETKCYEALGTIRTLKKLHIRLDCTNPTNPGQPHDNWDEFNMKRSDSFYNGHLEIAIVNCAVDEALATSIWDIMSENTHNQMLESLMITCTGCGFGSMIPYDLFTISGNLSRSYLITTSIPGDRRKLKVVELSKESREKRDETRRKHEEEMLKKWGHRGLNSSSFQVFERLWPLEDGGKNWREAWSSWPLQRSE